MRLMLLGCDTGGTFTDFVLCDGDRVRVHKVLSTPHAPEEAILQGIRELGLDAAGLHLAHGSTVATNAVLEGKGARTAYITNRGFGDVLTIGRQARAELYNLTPDVRPPPVPAELCLETGGRIGADGTQIEPLTAADLETLRAQLVALAPEAVAINFLFSFLDDAGERAAAAAVPDGIFISRSSEVLAEYREYERGIATWLNACVGPRIAGYLGRLQKSLGGARIHVMQSSGGMVLAERAARRGVHMLLSGPAGGLVGAQMIGRLAGCERLLTLDMGGTSTDVALIDGEVRLTTEGRIGPYPVGVPMVDMHTIGAGGGSIARADAGGILHVGPESAGAAPGPACYGRGGTEPTVTDANLVLGRLLPTGFMNGRVPLDTAAARRALEPLAARLGLSVEAAAAGIIDVANEHMAAALRVISVQRGIDPREFTLMSFGGAGGLHVCALAEALGLKSALVPVHAGALSALGMTVAPPAREVSRTLAVTLDAADAGSIATAFDELEAAGRAELTAEGVPAASIIAERLADLRYLGQSYALRLPWEGLPEAQTAFHAAHRARYGHALDVSVELVNVRVGLRGPAPTLQLEAAREGAPARPESGPGGVPVYVRADLARGQRLAGPAIVTDPVATAWVAPGWEASPDGWRNLALVRILD